MTAEYTRRGLRREFKSAAKEAIDESDYVSTAQAERIIDRQLEKADFEDDPEGEDEDDLDSDLVDDGSSDDYTLDDLEESLPSDLFEAARAYLEGIEGQDRYLAQQEGELAEKFNEQHDQADSEREARAQAVAEDAETPVLDATVYDDEEDV